MKRVISLCQYLLHGTLKPVIIFYGILIFAIAMNGLVYLINFTRGFPTGHVSGLEFATTIFLFVVGLNSFKSGFLFAVANGFTRRQYHLAVIAMLGVLATAMAVADAVINQTVTAMLPAIIRPWPQGYPDNNWAALELWHWMMNLQAAALGLCITLVFYRLNRLGKWLLALSPVILSALLQQMAPRIQDALSNWFETMFRTTQGIGDAPNALIGALSMGLCAVALVALARLLIHGSPIKEQDR